MVYILEKECVVNASPDELWRFIATPGNLNEITPPDLQFEIVTDLPERMYDGLMIGYRVKIRLFGRRRWLTEIKHIRDGRSFVDEQRVGPYRLWFHFHEILPENGGTRIIDRVFYVMPFGVLGRLVHRLFVRSTLERIFDFRERRFKELFSA